MRELDRNQHSVYSLYYHLIMVTKYRRKVIDNDISMRGKEIFERIAPGYGITLEEWNHDQDHVHVMFRAIPSTEISKFINAYNGRRMFPASIGGGFHPRLSVGVIIPH